MMTIKHMLMALGLATISMTGAVSAQVIGGEVEIDGSRDDVNFLGGDMSVRGVIDGDISAIAGDGHIDAEVRGSVHFFGGDVYVGGVIDGDLEIAGGDIGIDSQIGGDVGAAGGEIGVSGTIGGSLSAAGGLVRVDATVGEDVELAGGQVVVSPESVFGSDLQVAAGEGELAGLVGGDAEIEGREITISGVFSGDVEIQAEEVYVLDSARIDGTLSVRGPNQPVIASGAQIGESEYEYEAFNFGAKHWDDIDIDIDGPWELIGAPFAFLAFAIPGSALLLGFLAVLMTPTGVSRIARTFRRKPLVSGLLGFISFALSPIALVVLTVLLAITVIGAILIPFLWLLLTPFLLLCLALGAIAVGDLVFNRTPEAPLGLGMRLVSLLVVLAVSVALGAIPVLGAIVGLILVFIGLGAWFLSGGEKANDTTPAGAGPLNDDNAVSMG